MTTQMHIALGALKVASFLQTFEIKAFIIYSPNVEIPWKNLIVMHQERSRWKTSSIPVLWNNHFQPATRQV